MGAPDRIVLGTRGSELALAQARLVEAALRRVWPELEIAREIIRTSGDERSANAPVPDRKAGLKGMFTREIEKQLLVRHIDVAVHSAKDLPSAPHDELEVRATLPRARTEDVLITKDTGGLTSLAAGAIVATGSVRRQHQLRWKRPDLRLADLRGNVPTRLRKLRENESWSAIILARAGLERLGVEIVGQALRLPAFETGSDPGQPERSPYHAEILSQRDFVPAGGQGAIALQIRRDNTQAQQIADAINDRATLLALRAEREFLRLLDGDCDSPVGVQARLGDDKLHLRAQVFESPESAPRMGETSGPRDNPEAVAQTLMQLIYGG